MISAVIPNNTNIYYFNSDKFNVRVGLKLIVEIDKVLQLVEVTKVNVNESKNISGKIIRVATKRDFQINNQN